MSATPEQIAIDEKALEAAARALFENDTDDMGWRAETSATKGLYRNNAEAAITAYLSATSSAADARIARLEEALRLIANATHPRFRAEDDIDLLYANEAAFGDCINIARAALGSDAV